MFNHAHCKIHLSETKTDGTKIHLTEVLLINAPATREHSLAGSHAPAARPEDTASRAPTATTHLTSHLEEEFITLNNKGLIFQHNFSLIP